MGRIFILAILIFSPALSAAAVPPPEFVPGQIIVKWRSSTVMRRHVKGGQLSGRQLRAERALQSKRVLYHLQERTIEATSSAITALRANPDVEYVEPNYIRRPFLTPNDTYYTLQWHLKAIKAEQGWDITTGDAQVIVALVDTGILPNHPDLIGRLLPGYDFISDSVNASDGTGWDNDPTDTGTDSLDSSAFHGTHIAGIVGAVSNNEKGIAGVNWACKILPVRALGVDRGKGADADIAAAIRWAGGLKVTNAPDNPYPAKIISLSFGGPGMSQTLNDAITDVIAKGVIVVAAAGNQNSDATDIFPAATPGVIAVGATQLDGKRAPYSNYGDIVTIMAPGGNLGQMLPETFDGQEWPAGILSTLYRTETKAYAYHVFEGTSQSAPIVAGVVSLMMAIKPELTNVEARKFLRGTADPRYRCPEGCGAGMVDVANVLTYMKTGNLLGNKLNYGELCEWDSQCKDKTCQTLSDNKKICSHTCDDDSKCPSGSSCRQSICVPSAVSQSNGPGDSVACNSTSERCEVVGSVAGCAISGGPTASAQWVLPLLLLGIALACRRSRK